MPFVEVEFVDLEFHETLGRGAAGSVYRAIWRSKNREVAVKKLNLLENEAEVLSSLSHRNIVQFFGAVTVPPNFCIITEYAKLGSLYEYLRKADIDFQQILRWAKEIALGMNYLHNEAPVTVIHRDLKSKNVVISYDLTAKICDFGSSKFHVHTTKLTLVGTFPWMAPEVIQQLPVTASCDVFSYGIVLWELLTNEVPYKGLEGLQVAWLVVAKEQRPTIPSSCPGVMADLMQKCWYQNPLDRLSFKQVLVELEVIMADDVVQDQVDTFLSHKTEWKREIEDKLEELKAAETALSNREEELKKKEQILEARERHLESIASTSSRKIEDSPEGEGHDVEAWSEHEVLDWLFSLEASSQLTQYATVFDHHHINGRSLFLLSDEDLLHMGIHSIGHRKELLQEVEHLRHSNHRLLHFPPLRQQSKVSSKTVSNMLEPSIENVTIIFGNLCRKRESPQSHKWKYLVDFDNPLVPGLIQTVQFVFSSSIPSDIVTLSQYPYLTPGWREGPHPPKLDCIIYYKDKVQRPRDTHYQFTPTLNGGTEEICVKLLLQSHRTSQITPLATPSPDNTATLVPFPPERTKSTPQLSGVWASRVHVIRPPLNSSQATPPSPSSLSSIKKVSTIKEAWPGSGGGSTKDGGSSSSQHRPQYRPRNLDFSNRSRDRSHDAPTDGQAWEKVTRGRNKSEASGRGRGVASGGSHGTSGRGRGVASGQRSGYRRTQSQQVAGGRKSEHFSKKPFSEKPFSEPSTYGNRQRPSSQESDRQ